MIQVKRNDINQTVRILQYLLNLTADGNFGTITESAVKKFQAAHKLVSDGICGPKTWNALAESQSTIRSKSSGNSVKAVQDILNISVDGKFGEQTESAVEAMQSAGELTKDGVIGPITWKYLLTQYVIKENNEAEPIRPVDYKQGDPRWGSKMYSNHGDPKQTIKNSGCGPSVVADIVATWYDSKITPVEMCKLAVDNGFCTYNDGTARTFFKFVADKYKSSKYIRTTDTDAVISALKQGAYVVALMGKGYWTGGGHYICLWKYEASTNRIYACDPGSSVRKYSSVDIFRTQRKEYFIYFK